MVKKRKGSNKSNVASGGADTANNKNQSHNISEKSIDELIRNVDDVKKIVEQFDAYMKNADLCQKLAEKARFPKALLEQLDGMLSSNAFEGLTYFYRILKAWNQNYEDGKPLQDFWVVGMGAAGVFSHTVLEFAIDAMLYEEAHIVPGLKSTPEPSDLNRTSLTASRHLSDEFNENQRHNKARIIVNQPDRLIQVMGLVHPQYKRSHSAARQQSGNIARQIFKMKPSRAAAEPTDSEGEDSEEDEASSAQMVILSLREFRLECPKKDFSIWKKEDYKVPPPSPGVGPGGQGEVLQG